MSNDPSEDLDPSWSTGGNLLFSSNRDGNFDIYLKDVVGEGLLSITDVGRDDEDGINERWPDMVAFEGKWRITYSSDRFGDWEIHSIDADGENIARATDHEDTDASASWGPSGEEFVFHSDRNKERVELFIAPDPYGDGQRSISAPDATKGSFPDWEPVQHTGTCGNPTVIPCPYPRPDPIVVPIPEPTPLRPRHPTPTATPTPTRPPLRPQRLRPHLLQHRRPLQPQP